MEFTSGIKAGDIVLPEIKSKDGNLTFKEIAIPEGLDLTGYKPFTDVISNIMTLNGKPGMQLEVIYNSYKNNDFDEYFICCYKNEGEFLALLEYAIYLRTVEFDVEMRNIYGYTNIFIDIIYFEKLLLYNGQPISQDEFKTANEYINAIYFIKNRRANIETWKPSLRMMACEMIKSFTPETDNGLLTWVFNYIKTNEMK